MSETKRERFDRVVEKRVEKVRYTLRLIGNCSNKSVYAYDQETVEAIFKDLGEELNAAKARFSARRTADGVKRAEE